MEETLRQPSRTGRKLSPSPPRGRHSRWLILDRIVHRSRRLHGVVDDRDATTSATSRDCVGRPVRASLRVACPPAVSRLHLHLPDRDEGVQYLEDMEEPAVVAAHRNSILFNVVVPFEQDSDWTDPFLFPVDYFVYSVSSPPSLTRLPPCFQGVAGDGDPKEEKYFQPYRRQRQRAMLSRELGLLCHGRRDDGEFTVADLSPHSKRQVELCVLRHAPPPPAAGGGAAITPWTVKRLRITPAMRRMGLNLASFTTDVVLPVSGRFLCWVDYYQGMLLVDFFFQPAQDTDDPDDQQLQLRFIPLPHDEALRCRRPFIDDGDPDPFRCADVTDDDAGIKFVCIITERRVQQRCASSHLLAFTIATWTLDDISGGEWRRDVGATIDDAEFFGMYEDEAGQNLLLPRVMPSFPVVSMVDSDVVCFLLKEDSDIFWMVEVNMCRKKLQSAAAYIKEEEGDQGYSSKKKVCRNFFDGHYFIPSQFSGRILEQG